MTDDQAPSVPGVRRVLGRLLSVGIVGAAVIATPLALFAAVCALWLALRLLGPG